MEEYGNNQGHGDLKPAVSVARKYASLMAEIEVGLELEVASLEEQVGLLGRHIDGLNVQKGIVRLADNKPSTHALLNRLPMMEIASHDSSVNPIS